MSYIANKSLADQADKIKLYYTPQTFETVAKIANSMSTKTKVNPSKMLDYVSSKVFEIINRFDTRAGKPFDHFLKKSISGYCLNYIRNETFLGKVNYTYLNYYNNFSKTGDRRLTCKKFNITLDKLNTAIDEIESKKGYTEYYFWNCSEAVATQSLAGSIYEVISEADVNFLYDIYVSKLEDTKLSAKYGMQYKDRQESLVNDLSIAGLDVFNEN